jgi:hypothetical protein
LSAAPKKIEPTPHVPEKSRRSVWAVYGGEGLKRAEDTETKRRSVVTFYVALTRWSGTRLLLRCVSGQQFVMEAVPVGGTYVYFPNGLVYVRETSGEINAKVHAKLQQIQEAWVAD